MLFKDYLEQINKYAEEHPETLELRTMYLRLGYSGGCTDIEVTPKLGYYTDDRDYFIGVDDFKYENELIGEEDYYKVNAICLSTFGNYDFD